MEVKDGRASSKEERRNRRKQEKRRKKTYASTLKRSGEVITAKGTYNEE